ncbi:tetratricopeptide repeat protein [Rhodococcus sp. CX]|nr:tetratricopeptide repeat protein [Rhodococcus sp. CX]
MLAAQTTDPLIRAYVSFAEGTLGLLSGDLEHVCSQFESARAGFSACGERASEISALVALATAYGLSGLTEQAIECHERALEITGMHGEKIYRTYSLFAFGVVLWQQGDADRAVPILEESLQISRQVRNPHNVAACLEALAWISFDRRDARRAAVLMGAADGLAQEVGISPIIHSTLVVHHDECARRTRETLGDRAFEAAHREGEQLGFDAAIAYALHERPPAASPSRTDAPARLTKRERQVADLIGEGLTNQAIARRLVISPRTAQGHVEHILAKLGFTSRAQVAAWVAEQSHD